VEADRPTIADLDQRSAGVRAVVRASATDDGGVWQKVDGTIRFRLSDDGRSTRRLS
jgi:hypothetical protein